MKQANGFVT
jgi:hypothetical protein